ncbi:uncharacterized protein KNAG_0M01530 [Huiozyma naganishii CBS 8797]|uniref:Uncharacterized protein n=1 Tax=Huiozyma naganishii (strain ATCC MYA-139 / BCRC 22969 / CBS 8797 / KCTC 17520 / NBRC 10181 / NCYC 3082 / Yp74L-3) TaxID=1071383 RepID=J7SBF6_HUIN7|nr:hypothetical protein KNAG_0M01530 [Kazachstania naganishii CBS 8797]CCK73006.1 hypothetical protein KNAG_0M01530 [Kazachstania naganishii CBS 8797]
MVWQKYWEDYWYKPLEKGALGPSPKAELIKNRPLRFQGKSRMDAYNPMYYTYNFGSDHGIPRSKTVSRLLDVVHSLSDMDFGVEPVSVKPVSTEPVKGINTSIKGFTGKKKIDEDTPKQDTKERRFKRFRNAIHQIKSRCKSSGSRNRIETNKAKDNSLKNNRQTQLQPERIEQKENHKSSTNKASNTVIPRKNFIILGELTVNDKSRVPLGYSRLWKETEKMGKRSVKIQHRQCCGTN